MYGELIQQILIGFAIVVLCAVSDGVTAKSEPDIQIHSHSHLNSYHP